MDVGIAREKLRFDGCNLAPAALDVCKRSHAFSCKRLKAAHIRRRAPESHIFAQLSHPLEPIPSETKQAYALRRTQPYRS